jgi:LmbE family N-acetylglucosaminyl deacetylase
MIPCLISLVLLAPVAHVGSPPRELKVMVIFAHPDEGEIYVGGTTALYTQLGHKVKFLSITNGDAGHFSMNPEDLAKRRFQEAMEAKRILNLAEYEVLDHHDGKLKDAPEIREQVAARIREFAPDVVFTYYPAIGGHNDNMQAGWIVRGASSLLDPKAMPVFLYVRDYFTTRLSYIPDVAVDIESVWDVKLNACGAHVSQVVEANPHRLGIMEELKASKEKRREYLYGNTYDFSHITPDNLVALGKWYGKAVARRVKYVEAFEIAEFGRQIRDDEVRRLMPMIGNLITLPGRTAWLDTGIDLMRGQAVEISSDGEIQWNVDGKQTCGPAGAVPYTRRGNKPMLGVNTGAIIGKIGEDSTDYFAIGAGQRMVPFATGRLFVGVNDDNVRDNDGAFRIWIRTPSGQ